MPTGVAAIGNSENDNQTTPVTDTDTTSIYGDHTLYEDGVKCVASPKSTPQGSSKPANFDPDPAAVEMFEKDLKPKIEELAPLYQKAAQEEGMADWEILPALHNLEYGLRRDNPTTNTGFRTPFQMNAGTLSKNGVDISKPAYTPGHELTDDEFVEVARAAIKFWLLSDGSYLKIDLTKSVTPEEAAKVIVAYKSGAGSVWFTGKADFNKHAYAWAGFDTTPEHKLPMPWGPGSPFGDEVAGTTVNKPGAATVFALLKGGNYGGGGGGGGCASSVTGGGGGGTAQPVSGEKADWIKIILDSTNVKWGNYGSAVTQKQDVEGCLTDNTLAGFAALVQQSGVGLPINALATDHGGCGTGGRSDHNAGRAIDIGYYGFGDPSNNDEGNKLYKFIYDNRQVLKVGQLIWQEPPPGYQCLNAGTPTECYSYYGAKTMGQHYHHIHVSFQ